MEETNIRKLYDQMLKDVDFDKIDLGLKNPNNGGYLQCIRQRSTFYKEYKQHQCG
jgi:hypothetical protein